MNKSLRLGAILLVITGLTGLILGIAYKITEDPIAQSRMRQKMEALRRVLPRGDDFREILSPEMLREEEVGEMYKGYREDLLVGYALTLDVSGYGGKISMMVGVDVEGFVSGVQILGHQETPGLGARASEPVFLEQFRGKGALPLKVVKPPSSEEGIQAITGATITTKSVSLGVEKALAFVREHLLEKKEERP